WWEIADRLYPENSAFGPGVDGEYIDSSEGYVTAVLDYDRSHFAGAECPLVFDSATKRPAIYRGLVSFEYARAMARDVHDRGRLMMANSTPDQFFWLVPQMDVVGTETNWNWSGGWQPPMDSIMIYRRAMCYGKPYCFLQNTDFSKFTHEMVEKFMKRSLAYGMFPGFFSADAATQCYFETPDLYNRDRALFKKYVPMCKTIAELGWEPVTCARSNDAAIYVERFGDLDEDGAAYFTVFNDSDVEKSFEILFDDEYGPAAVELLSDVKVKLENGNISGKLAPEDVRVYRFEKR
ncbi:MAG: hypothetical protein HUK22_04510, partial [Thermoguttaceae bacterium]|nr:hypothetical protein [Thermoguttaceae bacterium]